MNRPPRATLRLQIHPGYTFDDARADLPYFARLGVSHLYLSPVTRARPDSSHGYDVVDHACVDPQRGGEEALRHLSRAAAQRDMGLLLDIVPNHMATAAQNAWWWDVLAQGRRSAYADWFDIHWDAPATEGKLLAPFLGSPYDEALQAGELRLQYDDALGFHVAAGGAPYPLAPHSLVMPSTGQVVSAPQQVRFADQERDAILAAHDPAAEAGRRRLHELLERQHYRLAHWRTAAETINWRRFFEESGLIGVRVERDDVFEAVHALPLRLYAQGVIDGLRIDHVDGLAQPLAYCARLRAAMRAAGLRRPGGPVAGEPWIVVEKILAPGETLDARWAISGTTGYDFAADVGALLHEGGGEAALFQGWAQIAADARSPGDWLIDARRTLLQRHFGAERNALLDVLARLATHGPSGWTRAALAKALDALVAHYPTYRSYVEDGTRQAEDQVWFDRARRAAERGDGRAASVVDASDVHLTLLAQLDRWLGGEAPASEDARTAVQRFQQLTPPLAAKSLEDTVFYRYGCLLSRNEVGSHPDVFAASVEAFHAANLRRARAHPLGLLATATHDHKRGEDVRARLAVLSEMPDVWLQACRNWLAELNGGLPEAGPALAFRYMLMQALVGAWPPSLSANDAAGVGEYLERIGTWALKALREGKQLSSWTQPDTGQEAACMALIDSLAPGQRGHEVLQGVEQFVRRIEPAAIANGLVQTALQLTCPGVPDTYQGTEYRDFTLVDPDNRRAVDYAARARTFAQLPPLAPGQWPAQAWSDGRVKQALTARLLALRHERSDAFSGAYRPLWPKPDVPQLVAFSRGTDVVVIAGVKRAAALQADRDGMPVASPDFWGDAVVSLPGEPAVWEDVLRGRRLESLGAQPRVADVLPGFPLTVLCRVQG